MVILLGIGMRARSAGAGASSSLVVLIKNFSSFNYSAILVGRDHGRNITKELLSAFTRHLFAVRAEVAEPQFTIQFQVPVPI